MLNSGFLQKPIVLFFTVTVFIFAMGCLHGPPRVSEEFLGAKANPVADHNLPTRTVRADTPQSEIVKIGVRLYVKEENRDLVLQRLKEVGIEPEGEGLNNVLVYISTDQINTVINMKGIENFSMAEEQPHLNDLYRRITGTSNSEE